MNAAIVFDLVMLALLLVVAFAYARRGFAAGLVQFVGNLASLIGALVLSHQASPLLFTSSRSSHTYVFWFSVPSLRPSVDGSSRQLMLPFSAVVYPQR